MLNAKNHEREAVIIAQAGRPGTVTIATNMAGRGVDILLGGNPEGLARENLRKAGYDLTELEPEVWEAGSGRGQGQMSRSTARGARGRRPAHDRHRAARGPAYRQSAARPLWPPGRSRLIRFYVSLEDDLMRRFGGDAWPG